MQHQGKHLFHMPTMAVDELSEEFTTSKSKSRKMVEHLLWDGILIFDKQTGAASAVMQTPY